MLLKLRFARQGHLCEDDVMSKYDSVWILEVWRHIDGFMRCIHLGWTKYDIVDGLGVKYTGRHCDKCCPPWHLCTHPLT